MQQDVDIVQDQWLKDIANESPIVRFVNLVLFQAVADGATEVEFSRERATQTEESGMTRVEDLAKELGDTLDLDHDELEKGFAHLRMALAAQNDGFPPPEFEFKIKYRTHGSYFEMAPPPSYLHLPITCRLCLLSGIRFWATGSVNGLLDITIGGRRTEWVVQSNDLSQCLTLALATPAQVEEFNRRKPIEVPPLPEPLPDEPLPEYPFRPERPPSDLHAVVWFLSRTVFYGFSHVCVLLLLWFDFLVTTGSLGAPGGAFSFAAKLLQLPISLLPFDDSPWLLNSLLWGAGIALLVQPGRRSGRDRK